MSDVNEFFDIQSKLFSGGFVTLIRFFSWTRLTF